MNSGEKLDSLSLPGVLTEGGAKKSDRSKGTKKHAEWGMKWHVTQKDGSHIVGLDHPFLLPANNLIKVWVCVNERTNESKKSCRKSLKKRTKSKWAFSPPITLTSKPQEVQVTEVQVRKNEFKKEEERKRERKEEKAKENLKKITASSYLFLLWGCGVIPIGQFPHSDGSFFPCGFSHSFHLSFRPSILPILPILPSSSFIHLLLGDSLVSVACVCKRAL